MNKKEKKLLKRVMKIRTKVMVLHRQHFELYMDSDNSDNRELIAVMDISSIVRMLDGLLDKYGYDG